MDRKLDELLFALMQNMTIAVSGEKLARDLERVPFHARALGRETSGSRHGNSRRTCSRVIA